VLILGIFQFVACSPSQSTIERKYQENDQNNNLEDCERLDGGNE